MSLIDAQRSGPEDSKGLHLLCRFSELYLGAKVWAVHRLWTCRAAPSYLESVCEACFVCSLVLAVLKAAKGEREVEGVMGFGPA